MLFRSVDRRCKRVLLTATGRSLRDGLMAQVHKTLAESQGSIPQEQMATCKDVLHQVLRNLSERNPREGQ